MSKNVLSSLAGSRDPKTGIDAELSPPQRIGAVDLARLAVGSAVGLRRRIPAGLYLWIVI